MNRKRLASLIQPRFAIITLFVVALSTFSSCSEEEKNKEEKKMVTENQGNEGDAQAEANRLANPDYSGSFTKISLSLMSHRNLQLTSNSQIYTFLFAYGLPSTSGTTYLWVHKGQAPSTFPSIYDVEIPSNYKSLVDLAGSSKSINLFLQILVDVDGDGQICSQELRGIHYAQYLEQDISPNLFSTDSKQTNQFEIYSYNLFPYILASVGTLEKCHTPQEIFTAN